jgi:hypothetical protein
MKMFLYSSADAANQLGISEEELQIWTALGEVDSVVSSAQVRRYFSDDIDSLDVSLLRERVEAREAAALQQELDAKIADEHGLVLRKQSEQAQERTKLRRMRIGSVVAIPTSAGFAAAVAMLPASSWSVFMVLASMVGFLFSVGGVVHTRELSAGKNNPLRRALDTTAGLVVTACLTSACWFGYLDAQQNEHRTLANDLTQTVRAQLKSPGFIQAQRVIEKTCDAKTADSLLAAETVYANQAAQHARALIPDTNYRELRDRVSADVTGHMDASYGAAIAQCR